MNKTKYLLKKNLLFSNVFSIKEEKDENKEMDSNEEISKIGENKTNDKYNYDYYEYYKNKDLGKIVDILLYSGKEKTTITYYENRTIQELVQYLYDNDYLKQEDNNYKIIYGLEELKPNDYRQISEIISDNDDNQIRIILKKKEKDYIQDKKIEKIYASLENIPSFMDLSEQINVFIKKHKNEDIKYDIKYRNNCCNIMFLSPEISFSFVTFMTNLKFTNKYYRKLIVKIKYNTYNNIKKNNHCLNRNSIILNNSNSTLLKTRNNKSINFKNSFNNNKITNVNRSGSYKYFLLNTEPNKIDDYFNERYKSINESTPYEQENILKKLEKQKSKKKWITHKGFFNGANTKSFNRFINPNNSKLQLSSITNNNNKIFLNVNNL